MSDGAAERRPWRVYVGDELLDGAVAAESTHEEEEEGEGRQRRLLDAAFARRARYTLDHLPARIRQQPSAAPSPVLRWLLLHGTGDPSSTSRTTVATPRAGAAAVAAHAPAPLSPAAAASSSATAGAVSALARRGVRPKDPLQQRLLKKQQQAAAAAAAATPPSPAVPEVASMGAVPGGTSHWSQHAFSAMTAVSWHVFRQQLGITIELVAPTGAAAATATSSTTADANRAAAPVKSAMPAADSLPAIRCWEEAQLPLSLGRCVTHAYALPTAVQAQCVPLALAQRPSAASSGTTTTASALGMDVLAVAETGSGKTAAYLVPLLCHVLCRAPKLLGHPDRISLGPLSVVIVPTRELAEQVTASLLQLCGQASGSGERADSRLTQEQIRAWEAQEMSDGQGGGSSGAAAPAPSLAASRNLLSEFRVVKVVGGESREAQYAALANGAHCVVGTVGQLQTLLEDRLLSLGNTEFVVVDEADRMIDEQQEERLVAVLERCPLPRQTVLFTATLSSACAAVAKRYLAPSGYYLVRTPYRCASIRQSFELVPDSAVTTDAPEDAVAGAMREVDRRQPPQQQQQRRRTEQAASAPQQQQQQRQRRRLHPLIHAVKFARLVTWLVYATGPIIVFANAKATCDALWEELRAEAEHLDAQQEYFTIEDLVGPPPDGLTFREDGALHNINAAATPGSSVSSAGAPASAAPAPRRTPTLSNLTSVAVVHAELAQAERRSLVAQFQRRQRQVLITTDLLARGLDVAGVTLVLNYDVPWTSASGSPADAVALYIHRIGRTGRAGSTGVAVTLVTLPAAMVQRAEEVARDERASGGDGGGRAAATAQSLASMSSASGRGTAARGVERDGGDGGDDDALAELFDGDTRSVWMAGAAAASGDGGGGRRRRRGEDEDEDEDGSEGNEDSSDADAEDGGGGGAVALHANGNGTRAPRKKKRKTAGEDGGRAAAPFASDAAVLRPLWGFLVECAEGEGCRDGAAALRRGTYAKISMPPALACIMAQLAATSQFGRITL